METFKSVKLGLENRNFTAWKSRLLVCQINLGSINLEGKKFRSQFLDYFLNRAWNNILDRSSHLFLILRRLNRKQFPKGIVTRKFLYGENSKLWPLEVLWHDLSLNKFFCHVDEVDLFLMFNPAKRNQAFHRLLYIFPLKFRHNQPNRPYQLIKQVCHQTARLVSANRSGQSLPTNSDLPQQT